MEHSKLIQSQSELKSSSFNRKRVEEQSATVDLKRTTTHPVSIGICCIHLVRYDHAVLGARPITSELGDMGLHSKTEQSYITQRDHMTKVCNIVNVTGKVSM